MDEFHSQIAIPGVEVLASAPAAQSKRTSKARREIPRAKTEVELLNEISEKLDRVVAVLAAQGKDRDTQAAILAAAGCDSNFLAMFLGISSGAVRNLPGWRRAKGGASENAGGAQ